MLRSYKLSTFQLKPLPPLSFQFLSYVCLHNRLDKRKVWWVFYLTLQDTPPTFYYYHVLSYNHVLFCQEVNVWWMCKTVNCTHDWSTFFERLTTQGNSVLGDSQQTWKVSGGPWKEAPWGRIVLVLWYWSSTVVMYVLASTNNLSITKYLADLTKKRQWSMKIIHMWILWYLHVQFLWMWRHKTHLPSWMTTHCWLKVK